MIARNPLFNVRDGLDQAVELAVAALKHKEQAKGPGSIYSLIEVIASVGAAD